MTKIKPFRGLRYNLEKITDPTRVMAPPYDVISPELQDELYQKSKYNVVRIDFSKEEDGLNRYEAAKRTYESWKKEKVLISDPQPSIYIYFHTFTLPNGKNITRKGFMALRFLEEFKTGGVRPHEQTFPGPKADRLQLMRATHANFSPIFSLVNDPHKQIDPVLDQLTEGKPDLEVTSGNAEEHRLWKIDEEGKIRDLLEVVRDKPLMIADGHHRYETALAFCEEQKALLGSQYTGKEKFNDVMMYFCSLEDPGLVVLPTHRVLANTPDMDENVFFQLLQKFGKIKTYSVLQLPQAIRHIKSEGQREHLLGWVYQDKIEVIQFDVEKLLQSESLNHLHYAVRDLDATILHDLVLGELLGITKGAQREYGNILYIKDAAEAVVLAQEKKTYAFLMNATKLKQLQSVIEIREKMPQKSTFFYPKALTGLVFNDFGI
jgi:uncharacterized protein (DUF1015 family)